MNLEHAFTSFKLWLAMKQHFTNDKYDFIKYHGAIKTSNPAFQRKSDRFQYYYTYKKYRNQLKYFYLSIFCQSGNSNIWIGDTLDDAYSIEFLDWQRRDQATKHQFTTDLNTIQAFMLDGSITFKDVLKPQTKNLPVIIQLEKAKYISPETAVIINYYTKFTNQDCPDPRWNDERKRLTKYFRFVNILKHDYLSIMRNKL